MENELKEKFVLYVDSENGNTFVRGHVITRFFPGNVQREEKEINGVTYFKITEEEKKYILENQETNHYSNPYLVEEVEIKNHTTEKEAFEGSKNTILSALEELRKTRDVLSSVTNDLDKTQALDSLAEQLKHLESDVYHPKQVKDLIMEDVLVVDEEIKRVQKELKEFASKYDETYEKMQGVIEKEEKKLNSDFLYHSEELEKLREEFLTSKLAIHEESIALKKEMENQKRRISSLKSKKTRLLNDIKKSEALGITVDEYHEITKVLRSRKIIDSILERKGLNAIVEKSASSRSKDEKQQLKEAKEEIMAEISQYREKANSSILEAIEALYHMDIQMSEKGKPRVLQVSLKKYEVMTMNASYLPEKVRPDIQKVLSNYQTKAPLEAPIDMIDVKKEEKNEVVVDDISSQEEVLKSTAESESERKDFTEKITIFMNQDTNDYYVSNAVLTRFNLPKKDLKEVEVEGVPLYKIDEDSVHYIEERENNSYSPFRIVRRDFVLPKEEVVDNSSLDIGESVEEGTLSFENLNTNLEEISLNPSDIEKSTDVHSENNDDFSSDEVISSIFGETEENLNSIKDETNHGKEDTSSDEKFSIDEVISNILNEEENAKKLTKISITVYRDLDSNDLYATKENFQKMNMTVSGDSETMGNGLELYKLSDANKDSLDTIRKDKEHYDIKISPFHLHEKKEVLSDDKEIEKPRPHVEEVIYKITKDLEIRKKDAAKYKAIHLKPSKAFVEELHSGNYLYNIVHIIPSVVKASMSFFRKISAKLMSSGRMVKAMDEVQRRLNEDLTEEDLSVLFTDYRGSQLKTDMNTQINPLILDRLKRYGLEKVSGINEIIKTAYGSLFACLGQIKSLEEKLQDEKTSKEQKASMNLQKKTIMEKAATFVKIILDARREANNLLSGGVHGLEEDFKAVQSKLSYVGMRFAKVQDFDNKLQAKLARYGQKINLAILKNDNEELVDSFMGLESCYYKNTKFNTGITGKKSVGSKYYSPLAEEFDYRDDPFVRDLFTTLAISTATLSTVNAIQVHKIESPDLLARHQEHIHGVNEANTKMVESVREAGNAIENRRVLFQEGMEAQAHQNLIGMDRSSWRYGDCYHVADDVGSSFFNKFHQDITSQLEDIGVQYGKGNINSMEALSRMADVSRESQATLVDVCNNCLEVLKPYAKSHPEYNISAIQESLEYVISHPNAIDQMNQAMIDVANYGTTLSEVGVTQAQALASLPSDMLSTIECSASAVALAFEVTKSMSDKYLKKRTYGNDITKQMDNYLISEEDLVVEEEKEEATKIAK